jgi:hypothetical protein
MKKSKEAEFYIKNKQEDVIEVYFSREELIEHLSSLVLKSKDNTFIKFEER